MGVSYLISTLSSFSDFGNGGAGRQGDFGFTGVVWATDVGGVGILGGDAL